MQFEYSETSSGSQCPIPLDFALRFDHLADQLGAELLKRLPPPIAYPDSGNSAEDGKQKS
ncbi:MAG: hypothetical protein DMG13_33085 [Acidobacteria bacterium]|nr:MAG: hypothetical protein DMG13_33085 [Acidobacteriota bacterium]